MAGREKWGELLKYHNAGFYLAYGKWLGTKNGA
jgi:hypothetical protein